MMHDFASDPQKAAHVWSGEYISKIDGAYYDKQLHQARLEHRIGSVSEDALMRLYVFFDIGGTGKKSDATAAWVVQFVGGAVNFLNYYEAEGQPLAAHVNWLHANGCTPARAQIVLPHDGAQADRVYSVTYESAFRECGYNVHVVKNQGTGAAISRIEASRRKFASYYFDSDKCRAGIKAITAYHEKRDEKRSIGLGPNHDWSSHGADAFGMVAIFKNPNEQNSINTINLSLSRRHDVTGATGINLMRLRA
jgi:phage terminase large subunit